MAAKKREYRAKTTNRKTCTKCGTAKRRNQFTKDRSRKDGLYPVCKECRNRYDSHTVTAAEKKQHQNAQRYLKIVAQLHDERTDREPRKGECNYSGCTRPKVYANDPYSFGFCPTHETNAAEILGYKLTA